MGGATKLRFPLPHRRQKHQSQEVQSISLPMTNKAQKLLGNAEINIDSASPTSPHESSKPWETRSAVSGISVTVSETTASESIFGPGRSTITAGPQGKARVAWDQESDIIPKGLGISGSSAERSQIPDLTTDASSLRRRGSTSTITSYYDKSKLPLSISQQTSNSAMAKGLPNKAAELLDMECPRPAPSPPVFARKKSSKLDLKHLLPSAASSRLARFAQKGSMVLGPDLLTRSPSVMSLSSATSPTAYEPKAEKKLRKKLTKESLRNLQSPQLEQRVGSWSAGPSSTTLRTPVTDTGNLHHLYEHYEQTSFRDTVNYSGPAPASPKRPREQDMETESRAGSRRGSRHSVAPSSPSVNQPRHHVSPSFSSVSWRPFPTYTPDGDCGRIVENPRVSVTSSNLVSPQVEYAASVSSRHTRTSKASKRTESFADFDPNATSVLSLSSDSEDDYPEPPKTGASIPSVGSRDSVISPVDHRRPSNTSLSQESIRIQPKSKFRASLSPQPFLAIPEHENTPTVVPPKINQRSSSLSSALTSNNSPRPSVSTTSSSVRSPSRLSQVSASTSESVSVSTHFSRTRPSASSASPKQPPEVRHVAMLQSRTATPVPKRHEAESKQPQGSPRAHLSAAAKISQPTPPISPSSMEFVIRDQCDSMTGHEGPVLTLSGAETAGQERFIAVTRQEERLLAAMRAKRALMMRENQQIADGDDLDRGNDTRDKMASKKESLSSIKTVKANTLVPPPLKTRSSQDRSSSKSKPTTLRFPEPPSVKSNAKKAEDRTEVNPDEKHEQVLMYLDRTMSTMNPLDMAEPSPDLSDFIVDFDAGQFPSPPSMTESNPTHSRNSSTASAAGRLTHPKARQHQRASSFGRPRPDSEFMPKFHPLSPESAPPVPSQNVLDLDAMAHKNGVGLGTARGRTTKQGSIDIARPHSPATFHEEEEFVEQPQQPTSSRKKAVRISAVGLQLPEIGQWGDDG